MVKSNPIFSTTLILYSSSVVYSLSLSPQTYKVDDIEKEEYNLVIAGDDYHLHNLVLDVGQ